LLPNENGGPRAAALLLLLAECVHDIDGDLLADGEHDPLDAGEVDSCDLGEPEQYLDG